jgi:hypothetical protein
MSDCDPIGFGKNDLRGNYEYVSSNESVMSCAWCYNFSSLHYSSYSFVWNHNFTLPCYKFLNDVVKGSDFWLKDFRKISPKARETENIKSSQPNSRHKLFRFLLIFFRRTENIILVNIVLVQNWRLRCRNAIKYITFNLQYYWVF